MEPTGSRSTLNHRLAVDVLLPRCRTPCLLWYSCEGPREIVRRGLRARRRGETVGRIDGRQRKGLAVLKIVLVKLWIVRC